MSEKRSTDVTEPTPNVDSPVKKKVKTDDVDTEVDATNGAETTAEAAGDAMAVEEKDTNGTETKTDSADDAAATWTPPPFGSVCWIQIPATDVARSKAYVQHISKI